MVLALGIGYMLVARYWLAARRTLPSPPRRRRRNFRDLIREYRLSGRARRLAIRAGSPLIGRRLDDLKLREKYGANVVGTERWRKFRRVMVTVTGETTFRDRDVLLIDMSAAEIDLRQFCSEQRLEPLILRGDYFSDRARDVGMAEVLLTPDSELTGKSVRELGFRSRFGVSIIGIRRRNSLLEGTLTDEPLEVGDTLLAIGDWRCIQQLQQQNAICCCWRCLPRSMRRYRRTVRRRMRYSAALMVALMITDVIPGPIAALIACLLMGKFRCIDMESARKAIHWPGLILIAGMMPFALALQKTGGVALVVQGLMDVAGSRGAARYAALPVCAVRHYRPVYLNTATAVLMAPIGVAAAQQMGVSPYPFTMIIAIAASAAFMTPVSSPVNTLVLGRAATASATL